MSNPIKQNIDKKKYFQTFLTNLWFSSLVHVNTECTLKSTSEVNENRNKKLYKVLNLTTQNLSMKFSLQHQIRIKRKRMFNTLTQLSFAKIVSKIEQPQNVNE